MQDLACRSINDERIDTADLGSSRSNAFNGFKFFVDWPTVADYTSYDFMHEDDQNEGDGTVICCY